LICFSLILLITMEIYREKNKRRMLGK
jgi:hypothetical protein